MADAAPSTESIEAQLRAVGRIPMLPEPGERGVEAIMARLEAEPIPAAPSGWQRLLAALAVAGSWIRSRWRMAGAVLAAALLALFVASPAGAGIRDWLGFGSVVVVTDPASDPAAGPVSTAPSVSTELPSNSTEVSLTQARSMVAFGVGVPTVLGAPDRVGVTTDGGVVVMQWADGTDGLVELDQIAGSPDPYYAKKFYQDIEFTSVDGREALWLAQPHPIVVVGADGSELMQTARLSGPSLIWQRSGVTLRLEGVPDRDRAIAIAESLQV